jgi:hypothetical protein
MCIGTIETREKGTMGKDVGTGFGGMGSEFLDEVAFGSQR